MDVLEGACMDFRPRRVIFNGFGGAAATGPGPLALAVLGNAGAVDGSDNREGISRLRRSARAPSMRSGVRRLMTPRVRWSVPRGRMALSGIPLGFSGVRSSLTPERKAWRDFCSCGREVGVTRGMQRKCVRCFGAPLGGICKCYLQLPLNFASRF
jgi:hypothetical protein